MLDQWIVNEVLRLENGMVLRLLKLLAMRFESGYDDRNAHWVISSAITARLEPSETVTTGRDDVILFYSPVIPHVTIIV
jgi:hypothetical protein